MKHLLDPNLNIKSTLLYPFGSCSNISSLMNIFSRNWHLLLVLNLLMSGLTFLFLLLSLLMIKWYPFILVFRRSFLSVSWMQTNVHTNMCYQTSNIFGGLI